MRELRTTYGTVAEFEQEFGLPHHPDRSWHDVAVWHAKTEAQLATSPRRRKLLKLIASELEYERDLNAGQNLLSVLLPCLMLASGVLAIACLIRGLNVVSGSLFWACFWALVFVASRLAAKWWFCFVRTLPFKARHPYDSEEET